MPGQASTLDFQQLSASTLNTPYFRLQQQQIRLNLRLYSFAPLLYQKRKNMKIVVTGSLGHISKPLTEELVQNGHGVTVVSSKPERQNEIEALGATAAIGTMEDADFLSATFTDADIVYVMETHGAGSFFDPNLDLMAAISK